MAEKCLEIKSGGEILFLRQFPEAQLLGLFCYNHLVKQKRIGLRAIGGLAGVPKGRRMPLEQKNRRCRRNNISTGPDFIH